MSRKQHVLIQHSFKTIFSLSKTSLSSFKILEHICDDVNLNGLVVNWRGA